MGEEGLQRIALWQSVPDEGRRISYADGGQGFRGVFFFFLFTLLSTLTAGAQDIEYYDLWLGSTQVTSANKDNILNQVDADGNPTATFDGTELKLNNPTITGTYNNSKIYSRLDELYLAGSYHMSEAETDYGIYAVGDISIAGNVDGKRKVTAIQCRLSLYSLRLWEFGMRAAAISTLL